MKKEADVIFINGSVITVDAADRVYEAVAVADNKIIGVGTSKQIEELVGVNTQVLDLKGRSILPGFIDAHCHPGNYGAINLQIRCGHDSIGSIEELKSKIKERAANTPLGDWILGRGYDETKLKERRHPNCSDFDEAAPYHKVFITRACGHISVANSLVLVEFDISRDTPDPPGGKIERDSAGEPTGVLYEQAQMPIRLKTEPSKANLEKGMAIMNQAFISRGITSAHDASGRNLDEIRLFQKGVSSGCIKVRLYFMVRSNGNDIILGEHYLKSGLSTGFGNERLRLGSYKIILDGSGSGGSAAMRDAYPHDPSNFGILRMTQNELDDLVVRAHTARYQLGVHAIGDRAIEMTLQSFAKALSQHPRKDHRHRIEHCGFLDEDLIRKIRELRVLCVLGLPFLYELGDNYLSVFDLKRLSNVYPLRTLIENGVISPLSSDAPVIDPNPMHGIYFAVTRKTSFGKSIAQHEKISVMQAIRSYTTFGAYASFEEGIKGSIEVGKKADLVVLSRNILKIPPEEILELSVDLTMVDGEIVYAKDNTVLSSERMTGL